MSAAKTIPSSIVKQLPEEFPYKRNFFDPDVKFKEVQRFDRWVSATREDVRQRPGMFPRNYFFDGIDRPPLVLTVDPEAYNKADIITDYFTEHLRMQCWVDGHPSPARYWSDPANANKIWEAAKKVGEPVGAFELREAMYSLVPECTQFKATLSAKVVAVLADYLRMRPQDMHVIDTSGGWGDRMIGCAAAGVKKLTTIDPNSALHGPYKEIIRRYCAETQVRTIALPLEEVHLEEKGDLVFTSPPFADFEHYHTSEEDAQFQSSNRYTDWAREWLFPMLEKMTGMVRPGGLVAIYISDTRKSRYTQDMVLHMKKKGVKLLGVIACRNGSKRPLPLWVWRV